MEILNRYAITVTAKQPFIEWANKLTPELPIEINFFSESHTYLTNPDLNNAEEHIKKYYKHIFEEELESIWTDENDWPKEIDFNTFCEWFDFVISDWVQDLSIKPLFEGFQCKIAPPIKTISTPPPFKKNISKSSENTILGLNRKTFLIVLGLIVIGFVITITVIQDFRKDKIEEGNKETEIYNKQVEVQNEEIAKQKEIIAEQERLEQERITKEKQAKIDKRIEEISNELNVCYLELDKAKKNLVDVKSFKFLRSDKERENDISLANEEISIWENDIVNLEKEMNQINPNWGKL